MKTCPCVLTGTLTSPDKINGASRESISTVNKAQLTATGNGLLLKFNSETPDLLQDGVYTPNQRHVTTDGFHESRLAGEVFLYSRSFVTCLWKVPETDATTSTTICYHSLKEFTVPDRRCSSHLRTSLSICRFAQMAAICVTNCPNLWRCKKNSQMSGWLLPQGCKAYKEFPAACNYSRSDKVTWYRPRGQLLCRVCVGDRNPHLCLLLNCMKLHRLSAVLYTSHLNETNECYSLPPYRYRLRLSRSHLNSF